MPDSLAPGNRDVNGIGRRERSASLLKVRHTCDAFDTVFQRPNVIVVRGLFSGCLNSLSEENRNDAHIVCTCTYLAVYDLHNV